VVHLEVMEACGEPTTGIAWGMETIRTRKRRWERFREEFGADVGCSLFSTDGGECTELQALTRPFSRCAVPGVFAYLR